MRVTSILLIVVALLVAGCGPDSTGPVGPAAPQPGPTDPAPARPDVSAEDGPSGTEADSPDGGQVMAVVNGKRLYMAPLHEMLVRQHGLELAQQLVANELVRQKAAELNIEVTEADIQAEQTKQLAQIFPSVDDAAQREALLGQFLQRTRVTPAQWRLAMRRNALLGKLADRMVRITEPELRQAFGRRYQRKVVVRHMQLPSMPTAALTRKNLLSGVDFAALARQKSMGPSAADGGLLPPFGRDAAEIHPDLRDAAFSMQRIGQISEILKIGKSFHLLKLEKIIEPEDVTFEDVREQLARQVRAERIEKLKQSILTRLFVQASRAGRIRFVDPTLRELSDQARSQDPTDPTGD